MTWETEAEGSQVHDQLGLERIPVCALCEAVSQREIKERAGSIVQLLSHNQHILV